MKGLWLLGLFGLVLLRWAQGNENWNGTKARSVGLDGNPTLVDLTLIPSAVAKGAVCLDGSPPGYHLHRGYGTGANSWLIELEGGGWCNNIRTCVYRKQTRRGSSKYMEKQLPFTGILSYNPEENPDFYNWNRVRVRYCDGASFAGEGYDEAAGLYFRGRRIWSAAMEELMSKGMHSAEQAILSGCSAGGLSSILHCDEFRALLPESTTVKCLADAGLFLDVADIAGRRTIRSFFEGVVNLQGLANNLPRTCTAHMDATSCFFPQNLVANIQTPTFLLNTAYDVWQLIQSLAPNSADMHGFWKECKADNSKCTADQIQVLQGIDWHPLLALGFDWKLSSSTSNPFVDLDVFHNAEFRSQMLNAVKGFSASKENGLFINSCFAHCQSELQDTWYARDSPSVANKEIAKSVGDWFFDRTEVKLIDCPYPCDKTCHNLVSRQKLN